MALENTRLHFLSNSPSGEAVAMLGKGLADVQVIRGNPGPPLTWGSQAPWENVEVTLSTHSLITPHSQKAQVTLLKLTLPVPVTHTRTWTLHGDSLYTLLSARWALRTHRITAPTSFSLPLHALPHHIQFLRPAGPRPGCSLPPFLGGILCAGSFSSGAYCLFVRLQVPGAISQGAWRFRKSREWLHQPSGDL